MNLTALLQDDAVPLATLHQRYGSLLELVRKLIGVVPNCDRYLEIWPPAFRSYNVMVPNLLDLPLAIWKPRPAVGLALYASSRAAGCSYCSAHTCSFALRRGVAPDVLARALDGGALGPREAATVAVAQALGRVPAALDDGVRDALTRACSPSDVEWIVLAIAMMGFLNKLMDALGVELEEATMAEVDALLAGSGWTPGKHAAAAPPAGARPRRDGLATKLGVVPYIPAALELDRRWTKGVPDRWPAVGEYLRDKTGHDFPVLARLRHKRAIRAIATMVAESFDGTQSVIGLGKKRAVGQVFAEHAADGALVLALAAGAPSDASDPALMTLARAIAPSPARVDDAVVAASRALAPAAIVEVVTFVAVLQLLHRLHRFYR